MQANAAADQRSRFSISEPCANGQLNHRRPPCRIAYAYTTSGRILRTFPSRTTLDFDHARKVLSLHDVRITQNGYSL